MDHRNNSYIFTWIIELVTLGVIIGVAGYLRLHNLVENPGWYTDEATHVNIAQNLLDGRVQYLAITESFLLFARFPLFEYTLAGTMAIFGEGIGTLRMLTGGLGILTVILLYLSVRVVTGERILALAGALALAMFPTAAIYSRFGFSYALLAPLTMITLGGLAYYITNNKRRGLILASLASGIGLTSDLMIGTLFPVIGLVALFYNWKHLLWCIPLCVAPFGIYAGLMLIMQPDVFIYDLTFILTRLSTMTFHEQMENIVRNYRILLTENLWISLGLVGLFLVRHSQLRIIALLTFLVPIAILGRTVALWHLSFYYMIPLLPIPMIGLGALLVYGTRHFFNMMRELKLQHTWLRYAASGTLVLFVIWMPFAAVLHQSIADTNDGFKTDIDAFLTNAEDGQRIADYINTHTNSTDLVIGSVSVLWLLDTRVSDYQLSAVWNGLETPHFPLDLPRERFAFNPSLDQAKYIIVDNLWRFWGAVHIPGVIELSAELGRTWPLVFESGDLQIFQNPDFGD